MNSTVLKSLKMMKKLNDIEQSWIKKFNTPLIISGPCSAESEEQVLETAQRLDKSYVQIFRAGIWKPRTRPNSFEGIGEKGFYWLKKVKDKTGLKIAIEVASAEHVKISLKHNVVDVFWIGARSTVNPFSVQEIANALEGSDKIVLVKNPINPSLDLWIGALERFLSKGVENLGVIHRGFSSENLIPFRNQPNWKMVLDFKNLYPHIPVLCDPSHICGNREKIYDIVKQAFNLEYNGLIVETHCSPNKAWSDSQQQITPEKFSEILKKINPSKDILEKLRIQIDEIDQKFIFLLNERLKLSKEIGYVKNKYDKSVIQINRWKEILLKNKKLSKYFGISEEFIEKILNLLHKESINIQEQF
ncbi:MAG TPA: bifunctional 3-deoxy-7-phosphoheptulonate synthase/chorismate mutase type II [Blattabacteriaceae bacterium]